MGKVIFEKTNGEKIKLSLNKFNSCKQIQGLYERNNNDSGYILNTEINKVRLEQCKLGNSEFCQEFEFYQSNNQSLEFVNCDFEHCSVRVLGGNLSICDSKFNEAGLDIGECNKVSLLLNKEESLLNYMFIVANNVVISGSLESNVHVQAVANVIANSLSTNNLKVYSNYFNFKSENLNLRNSIFYSTYSSHFGYNYLQLKDVLFTNYYSKLIFSKIIGKNYLYDFECQKVAQYFSPLILKDSDILEEKNQTIYSLLSVLKGYRNQINAINKNDIEKINSKLNRDFDIKKAEIIRKQEELTQELEKLNRNFDFSKKQAEEDLSNRKVKQLTYPKE